MRDTTAQSRSHCWCHLYGPLNLLLISLCATNQVLATEKLEIMQEINAETCEPYNGAPHLNPLYQVTNKLQLPTSSKFIDKLNILDLLDESEHAHYLATRSGAPIIQSRIQGLLATKSQSTSHLASYVIAGNVSTDFEVSNSQAVKSSFKLESPESTSGEFKLVIYDSEGLKIDTRRYDPYQIVMVGDPDSLESRLATVNLKADCETRPKFVTSVDGRYFEYAKQRIDYRLLFVVETQAAKVELTLHGVPLFEVDLQDID